MFGSAKLSIYGMHRNSAPDSTLLTYFQFHGVHLIETPPC